MIDKNKIQEILNDLYALDSSLRAREKEVIVLLEKLIKSKPQAVFNEDFAAELKRQLFSKPSELKQKNDMKKIQSQKFKINWRTMSYSTAGAAAFVFLALSLSLMTIYKQNNLSLKKPAPSFKNQIAKVSSNAFGTLALARNANQANMEMAVKNISPSASPVADGALSRENAASSVAPLGLGGGGVSAGKVMADSFMPPRQNPIKYSYTGEDFEMPNEPVLVYKKVLSFVSDFEKLIPAVKGLKVEGLNLSSLQSLKLDSLSIKEDRDFGYYLSFSPANNSFYMSKNWEKWPNPSAKCQDDKCWQENRVKLSDLPSDEESLEIAKRFISEYGINLDGYGQPFVQNSWRTVYEASTDKENYYFPEEVSVVYPLIIDGVEVRGQGGEYQGLMVGIDVKNRKASGFNGVISPSFESSEYEVISDKEQIVKMAEDGGMNGFYYYGAEDGQETVVELGTPQKALMQYWKYDQETGRGDELYIPALVFPVKKRPQADYFYIENIVVPLIKDVLINNNYPMLLKAEPAAGAITQDAVLSSPVSSEAQAR